MTTAREPTKFAGEARTHIEEINTQLADYKSAEERFTESQGQLEQAKSDVDVILSDVNADAMDCAERLVLAGAMVKVLEHRLALNQKSVADRLVSLARTVDGAERFSMGAAGHMARAIRQQKIAKIAQELNVSPGKIDIADRLCDH